MTEAEYDAAYAAGESRVKEAFGADAQAIPPAIWQAIMAAITAIITSCVNPTPANIKAQAQRPLVRLRLYGSLLFHGVPLRWMPRSQEACLAAINAAPDVEIAQFVAAVQSNQ